MTRGGELPDRVEVDDDAGGLATEEARDVALFAHVLAIEPDVAAEVFEHLVEELAAPLLRRRTGSRRGLRAGDVAGLRVE